MQYKTLQHKTLPDTYGQILDLDDMPKMYQGAIPNLQPMTATIEFMYDLYKRHSQILEELNDYDLVTVEVYPGVRYDPDKIDYNNTKALLDDLWLFLASRPLHQSATIKRDAFNLEVGAIIDIVREHTISTLCIMNPERFQEFLAAKFAGSNTRTG